MFTIKNASRQDLMADRIRACGGLFSRLRGLLWSKRLRVKEACWLKRCRAVHTFGMRYAIDVCFLDKKNKVIGLAKNLRPNRFSPIFFKAHSALEFIAGSLENCRLGDELKFEGDP